MVWILVLKSSPRAPDRLALGASAVLMGAHDGAVDHRVFIVGLGSQMLKDPLTDSRFGPPAEAPVVLPIAKPLRQIAPRNAGAVAIQHRRDKQPAIARSHSNRPLPTRQQVLDPVPLVVTKSVTAHRSALNQADRLRIEECVAPESAISVLTADYSQMLQARLTRPGEIGYNDRELTTGPS
jgi:hypothetical protein